MNDQTYNLSFTWNKKPLSKKIEFTKQIHIHTNTGLIWTDILTVKEILL